MSKSVPSKELHHTVLPAGETDFTKIAQPTTTEMSKQTTMSWLEGEVAAGRLVSRVTKCII